MHVSGGEFRQYRAAFRRDWPTYQPFPNLWPWRCELNYWSPVTDQLDYVLGVLFDIPSAVATVPTSGTAIQYIFRWDFGFNFAQCEWTIDVTYDADRFKHRWVWTAFDFAGFLKVDARGYGLSPNSNYWNFDGVFVPGTWSSVGTGDWDAMPPASNLLVRSTYVVWSGLPPEEQNP